MKAPPASGRWGTAALCKPIRLYFPSTCQEAGGIFHQRVLLYRLSSKKSTANWPKNQFRYC